MHKECDGSHLSHKISVSFLTQPDSYSDTHWLLLSELGVVYIEHPVCVLSRWLLWPALCRYQHSEVSITLRSGVLLGCLAPIATAPPQCFCCSSSWSPPLPVSLNTNLSDSVAILTGIALNLWIYLGAVDFLMVLRHFNINIKYFYFLKFIFSLGTDLCI